jgi:hypothetical protein
VTAAVAVIPHHGQGAGWFLDDLEGHGHPGHGLTPFRRGRRQMG